MKHSQNLAASDLRLRREEGNPMADILQQRKQQEKQQKNAEL